MAISYTCDNCSEEVKETSVISITIHQSKSDETVESHSCAECFDSLLQGEDGVAQTFLLG